MPKMLIRSLGVHNYVIEFLATAEFYDAGFSELVPRHDKCLNLYGGYYVKIAF